MTNTSPGALVPPRPTEVKIGGAMRPISSTLSTVGDGTSPTPASEFGSGGLVHGRGGGGQSFEPLPRAYLPAPHGSLTLSRPRERPSMDRDLDALLGFAPDYDSPIPYMQRTRDYYAAIGYTTPYRWAHYVEAPFTPLRKPLRAIARDHRHHRRAVPARTRATRARARRTTAAPSSTRSIPATPRTTHDLRISHIGYDRTHTTADRQRHLVSAARVAARGGRRPHRRGRAALPRRADQPQPPRHGGDRRAGDPAPLPRGRAPTPPSWCPTARSATRPAAWSRATWRRTASPPW